MKKLLFMLLCCTIFVIGCNNNQNDEFFEEDVVEIEGDDDNYDADTMMNMDEILNESDKKAENGDYAGAIADLKKVVSQAEYKGFLYAKLARLQFQDTSDSDNLKNALDSANNAVKYGEIEKDESMDWIYSTRAQVERGLDMLNEAMKDSNKAVELSPEKSWVYADRANVYRSMGEKEKALADYNKAISLGDDSQWIKDSIAEMKKEGN